MSLQPTPRFVTRRTAIASLGGASAALVAGSAAGRQSTSLADHPLTGVWMAMANPPLPDDPQVPAPSYYGADGTVVIAFPITQRSPTGVQVNSDLIGTWEAHDEVTGHFTAVQMLSDLNGVFTGTVTIDGFPRVHEDGQTFVDDGSLVTVTIRDPGGTVVATISGLGGRPVTGVRMAPGAPGIPEPAATPAG